MTIKKTLLIIVICLTAILTNASSILAETPRPAVVLGHHPAAARVPTGQQTARCLRAYELYRAGKINRVIVTGGFTREHISEARMMKIALVAYGVPEDRIIEEDRAGSTIENAKFTEIIFNELGWKKRVMLVTQPYHIWRATAIFEDKGFEVKKKPARNAASEKDFAAMPTPELPTGLTPLPDAVVFEPYNSDEQMNFPSPGLARRLRAAAALYRDGNISRITVFSDWYTRGYQDISEMMQIALISLGVRARDIVLINRKHYSKFNQLPAIFNDQPAFVITPASQKKSVPERMSAWPFWFID